jgi:hypothetical protein
MKSVELEMMQTQTPAENSRELQVDSCMWWPTYRSRWLVLLVELRLGDRWNCLREVQIATSPIRKHKFGTDRVSQIYRVSTQTECKDTQRSGLRNKIPQRQKFSQISDRLIWNKFLDKKSPKILSQPCWWNTTRELGVKPKMAPGLLGDTPYRTVLWNKIGVTL